MNEQKYIYRVQWLVLIGAVLLFLTLLGAWIGEGRRNEWKKIQKEYISLSEPVETGIFQVDLPHFKRVDRCISCHNGIEDPRMLDAKQPHTSHPGSYLEDHPVDQYGCTICHGGQGAALTREAAFGQAPETHWPHPLLEQPYIQASCGKCHLAIFKNAPPGLDENSIESNEMEGMEVFLQGKELFSEEGCLGCHKARGVGGILGPDLTEQGEKTSHEYSFQNIRGEQTISNWLKEHFKDPEMVSPGSQMLKIDLDEDQLEGLAIFVMGLEKPDIPFDYFTMETLNEFKGIREPFSGKSGFAYLCSGCHGKEGEGKNYKEYKTGIPSIGNQDFLRVASEDFLRFTLEKGRSLRQMGSWSTDVSGVGSDEILDIVEYLKKPFVYSGEDLHSVRFADPAMGAVLFEKHCLTCHGDEGKGGVAVALNQRGFLERATNGFMMETLSSGRGNTAMPGWSNLEISELRHMVSYIRTWDHRSPADQAILLPEANLEEGALKFHFLCSRCHGENGEGETGPAIINRDFLSVASDAYLYNTIARGREHTAMFGWSSDVYNSEKQGLQDISNLIGFMRNEAKKPLEYIFAGSNPGASSRGETLFAENCSECHGPNGEGVFAPALNNQEFLSAASNGYLLATITLGREGTLMPPWGYGNDEHAALTGKEREDLVAMIRSWQRIRIRY